MYSQSLIDYKFWCINGEPLYVFVCCNRSHEAIQISVYDIEWKNHPEKVRYVREFVPTPFDVARPECFEKMISIARKLSEGHPQMRVDLYEVDGKVYFGELTLQSAAGLMDYFSDDLLLELGEKIKIQ